MYRLKTLIISLLIMTVNVISSNAEEYKFNIEYSTPIGELELKSYYQLTYNSDNQLSLVDLTSIFRKDDIIKESGVKATLVNKNYLETNNYLLAPSDSEGGILFSKDGQNLCLVYFSTCENNKLIEEEQIIYWKNGEWYRAFTKIMEPINQLNSDERQFYDTFKKLKKDLTSKNIGSKTSTNNTTTSKSSASTSSPSKSTSSTNKTSVPTSPTQKESSYFNITGKVVNQKGVPIQACIQPLPGGDIITTGTDGGFTLRNTHKGAVIHFWIKGRFSTCKDITITRQMEKDGLTVRLNE